jgi:hypothetical protein
MQGGCMAFTKAEGGLLISGISKDFRNSLQKKKWLLVNDVFFIKTTKYH